MYVVSYLFLFLFFDGHEFLGEGGVMLEKHIKPRQEEKDSSEVW
jgi:hypothetical protein